MTELFTVENMIALLTLTSLEVVLGIDNIVLISVLTAKLPADQRDKARKIGISLAMVTRIALLFTIGWVMKMDSPIIAPFGHEVSVKDLILIFGGLFLIFKATTEIHDKVEGGPIESAKPDAAAKFGKVIAQILMLDIIFSLDSVITAVGMVDVIAVMVIAVIIAVSVMLIFSKPIIKFIEGHPTIKMLALSFLLLIGVMLVLEGAHQHISKGTIYFAMAFSLAVELLNLRVLKKYKHPSTLRVEPVIPPDEPA